MKEQGTSKKGTRKEKEKKQERNKKEKGRNQTNDRVIDVDISPIRGRGVYGR